MEDDKKAKVESLIDKFINELQEEYEQERLKLHDNSKLRTLTISPKISSVAAQSPSNHSDIDRKINDLENLIKKLQSEIAHIPNQSIKSQISLLSTSILNLKDLRKGNKSADEDDEDDEADCKRIEDCAPKDINTVSTVPSGYTVPSNYALPSGVTVTSDYDYPLSEASKRFDDAVADLITLTAKISESDAPVMANVKDSISRALIEERNINVYQDGIEHLIDGLKTNIKDQMKILNEPCVPENNIECNKSMD